MPATAQGHANSITCLAATEDRSTIITADVGQESLMVLWSSETGLPVRSIKQPHPHGVLAMDVAPGGAWLATIGAPNPETGEQEVRRRTAICPQPGQVRTHARRNVPQAGKWA